MCVCVGGVRNLHNDELNDLYFSPNIIRLMKSKRMKWAWYVARMGERRDAYKDLVRKEASWKIQA